MQSDYLTGKAGPAWRGWLIILAEQYSAPAVLQRRHIGRHNGLNRKRVAAIRAVILLCVFASFLDRYFHMELAATFFTDLLKFRLLESLGGIKAHLSVPHIKFFFIL
jgi:hypothetical protein